MSSSLQHALSQPHRSGAARDLMVALNPPVDPEAEQLEARRQALRELAQFNRDVASGKYAADREAQRQAEAEAERLQGLSTADLLREALSQANHAPVVAPHVVSGAASSDESSSAIPLNGAGVLRAMLRGVGGQGTINGAN